MQVDLNRFRETFFQESAEHLAEMEAGVLKLDQGAFDPELLNGIFRAAHSIKGSSGMFGLDEVSRFTHALESLLDRIRAGEIPVTKPLSDLLLRATDRLRQLLDAAASGGPVPEGIESVRDELHLAQRVQSPAGGEPVRLRESDRDMTTAARQIYQVHFRPAAEIFAQAMDPLLLLRDLARLGESASIQADCTALPELSGLDPERCYLAWNIRLETAKPAEEVRDVFAFVEDGAQIRIEVEELKPAAEVAAPAAAVAQPVNRDASIRVATSKVDRLVDLVGELVIAQSMAHAIVHDFSMARLGELQESIAQMERYTHDLQERVMSVRMLPISHIFGRFPRLVRDISVQLSKNVRLEISGEDTELDKGVVEQMADPLTHLIRNAIDHGIESSEERVRRGKPEQGLIRLAAFHQGGSVVVEVSDDGGGLNLERIQNKAVERGLVPSSEVLSEAQICDLIFSPGFSTSQQVSNLSGRGVGMDVVRRNVEALNGSVSLSTEPGAGTKIRIQLPLTLAILDGLSVRVGAETYLLPLVAIHESIRPRPEQLKTLTGRGEAVLVRGDALPLLRLHQLFAISGAIGDPCRGLTVIVEHAGQRFALLVDELLGEQQVVIKSLEANYRKVEGVLGATILGDGRAALILDVAGLAPTARHENLDRAA